MHVSDSDLRKSGMNPNPVTNSPEDKMLFAIVTDRMHRYVFET